MPPIELIATTGFGLEAVVGRELRQLGYDKHSTQDGRISFTGDEAAICRTNLWLRSAERVLVKVGEFEARDFGALFDRTTALPWEEWIPADAEFPVQGKSIRSQLHSVPDCQAIVKKAIVERLKRTYRKEWFPEDGPKYAVEVALNKDQVTLTLDTSGTGLHKRGYRKLTGVAPLRETTAAALVQLSFWNRERTLVDPCCGTGTIPVEAAMIAANRAPGLERTFAAEKWPRVPKQMWDEARTEARDRIIAEPLDMPIQGTDIDAEVLSLARYHAKQAGVESSIHFQQQAMNDFRTSRHYGCVITNPPWGERMGDEEESAKLYREMSSVLRQHETWSIYILTAASDFETVYGRRADRRRKLYNGRIACTYYQFQGPRPPRRSGAE